ncbi:hypothetical protein ColLi_11518 [Colletotrichum liriopes]|uniref:Uncharacterized protein n=1 Tax=Colletotrichum liriopes TaxID=708192 RepID=A0AA37GXT4_9PEZI|nr:hypothetical protein ColLi_11518 [Colletotrichum liriopes]
MSTKTYILAPNFTYKPNGPIQIGSIIADPFRPAKSLSQLTVPPVVETVVESNHEASRQTGRSLKLSLWAHVLNVAGAGIGASGTRDAADSISIERLETRYLAQDPADDDPELALRLREPRVQAAIMAGLYGRAPVYLVSGVKIARGLSVRSEMGRAAGGSLRATVPAAQAVGFDIGAEVEGERRRIKTSSFTGGDEDVLFAYQVHVIKAKGRKTRERVVVDVFESDAAFLHDDDDDEDARGSEDKESIQIEMGSVESLEKAARQMDMVIESEEVVRADGRGFVYVQAKEM